MYSKRNQQIFRELGTIVVKAWTESSFVYKGKFFRYFFPGVLAGSGSAFEQMMAGGLVLAGTVDDVKWQMEEMYKVAPFEYPFLLSYFALQSKESFLEDMELFATKVMPAFA